MKLQKKPTIRLALYASSPTTTTPLHRRTQLARWSRELALLVAIDRWVSWRDDDLRWVFSCERRPAL